MDDKMFMAHIYAVGEAQQVGQTCHRGQRNGHDNGAACNGIGLCSLLQAAQARYEAAALPARGGRQQG